MGVVGSGLVNLGSAFGWWGKFGKGGRGELREVDGKVPNAEQGISFFARVCPQHLLLEEMDEMGNWPPPE